MGQLSLTFALQVAARKAHLLLLGLLASCVAGSTTPPPEEGLPPETGNTEDRGREIFLARDYCSNCADNYRSLSWGNDPDYGAVDAVDSAYFVPSLPADGEVFIAVVPVILRSEFEPELPGDGGPIPMPATVWQNEVARYPPLEDIERILFSERLYDEDTNVWKYSPYGSLTEYFNEVSGGKLKVRGKVFSFAEMVDDGLGQPIHKHSYTYPSGAGEFKGYYLPATSMVPTSESDRGFAGNEVDIYTEVMSTLHTRCNAATGLPDHPFTVDMDDPDTPQVVPDFDTFDCVMFLPVDLPDRGAGLAGQRAYNDNHRSMASVSLLIPVDLWDESGYVSTCQRIGVINQLLQQVVQRDVGIPCHEFAHMLGLPDFYIEDGPNRVGEYFTIMGGVAVGEKVGEYTTSPYLDVSDEEWRQRLNQAGVRTSLSLIHPTALEKYFLGWYDEGSIVTILPSEADWGDVYDMPSGSGKKIYAVMSQNDQELPARGTLFGGDNPLHDRFILIENRGEFRGQLGDRFIARAAPEGHNSGLLGWYVADDLGFDEFAEHQRAWSYVLGMRPLNIDALGAKSHYYNSEWSGFPWTMFARPETLSFFNAQTGLLHEGEEYYDPVTHHPLTFRGQPTGPEQEEPMVWRPISAESDGSMKLHIGMANGTGTHPHFIELLSYKAEPESFEEDSTTKLSTVMMDTEFSYDYPPDAYATGTPFIARYYQVLPSGLTLLNTSTDWQHEFAVAINGDVLGGNSPRKHIRVVVTNTLADPDREAQADLEVTIIRGQTHDIGPVNGTPEEFHEEFAGFPDDALFYNEQASDTPGVSYHDEDWHQFDDPSDSTGGSSDRVVYGGEVADETPLGLLGYDAGSGVELRGTKFLRFIGDETFRMEVRLRYQIDSTPIIPAEWPAVGGSFADMPPMLTGDHILVEIRKKGNMGWTPLAPEVYSGPAADIISGPGPLRGQNPLWPDYNRIIIDLTDAERTSLGLGNSTSSGTNLAELRIRFVSDKFLQFTGVFVDSVHIEAL